MRARNKNGKFAGTDNSSEVELISSMKTLEVEYKRVTEECERLSEKGFVVYKEFLNEIKFPTIYEQMVTYVKGSNPLEIVSKARQEYLEVRRHERPPRERRMSKREEVD